jgi:nicotinate-nucleotide adenylyltransferase
MRLGIFGGTFNPIHYGHLRAAEEARFKNNLDKVIFIPSGNPPIKSSELADASVRYIMTSLAISSNPHFIVSDIELRQPDKSYTLNTLYSLKEIYAGDELLLILGIDAFLDMPVWWMPEKIIEVVDFIVVSRPGFILKDIFSSPYIDKNRSMTPYFDKLDKLTSNSQDSIALDLISGRKLAFLNIMPFGVSSTEIRSLVKNGISIKYLLPERVEQYIYEHNLYLNL